MKRKIAALVVIIIGILLYSVYWGFYDMGRLPKGELISEVKSPNGKYTIKAYVSNGGATTDFAVFGELNYNEINEKPKNIYWNYHENTATIKWIDNDTAIINGQKLNIINDTFDFRRR